MSIHSSLRTGKGAAGMRRNVLKRFERVRLLVQEGHWADGRSVFGLPKVKRVKIKARKVEPKEKPTDEATPTAEGADATPAAESA